MISRKHLTYMKNRLGRGAKMRDCFFDRGYSPVKTTERGILAGLRLYKMVHIHSYSNIVTSRSTNNMGYAQLAECVRAATNKKAQLQFIADAFEMKGLLRGLEKRSEKK